MMQSFRMSVSRDEDRTIPRVLRALIVEDSAPIAERLAEMILRPGRIEIGASVATERDALAACDAGTFDIAIVDLQLSQGTGFGVIRRLRERAGQFTCVVVLTNHAVPALRAAAYQAGADHFLDKSKDFPSVSQVVTDLLSSR